MIKLLALRLSSNPTAQVSPDGKFNVAEDGRQYLIAEFSDPSNPFGGIKRRTISQQFNSNGVAVWNVNLDDIRKCIGQPIEGRVVTHTVPSYTIGDRTVNTYTTVVFAHESETTVFKNAGHEIQEAVQPAIQVVSEIKEDLA